LAVVAKHIPVAISWDDIVNLQFLGDFLDAQVQSVGLELLARHVGHDGSGQAHQTSRLVFSSISPSVPLLAAPGTIGLGGPLGAAATLQIAVSVRVGCSIDCAVNSIVGAAANATGLPQRDVVRSRDTLTSPSHLECFSR
jgi:hypothetical protein